MNLSKYVVALAVALMLIGCAPLPQSAEITVQRINVVDSDGVVRMVIAGDLPDPIVRGEQYERSIAPAGIIWHDDDGNESGGLAVARMPNEARGRFVTFDFTHQPTDAVSMGTFESPEGERWMAGLQVYDRLPYVPGRIETSQGVRRVMLGTANGDAGLTVLDPQERERIRIGVDPDGTASIEILDEEGQTVFRIPADD
jgi:hypothetical protein